MKKVILISGGSDGLGRVVAEYLAKEYHVVILSPSVKKLTKVAKELAVDCVVADVTDYNSLQNVVKQIVEKYGRIDCLINNAGVWI